MAKDKAPVKDDDQVNVDDVEGGTDAGVQEQQAGGSNPLANLMKSRVVKILGYSLIAVALIIVSVLISKLVITKTIQSSNLSLKDQKFEDKKKDPLAIFTLEELKLSTGDKEEPHYVRVFVSFGYDEKNVQLNAELSSRRIQITDEVSKILMSKKKEELDDEGMREELKEELREGINVILQKGEVEEVYFTGFMVT